MNMTEHLEPKNIVMLTLLIVVGFVGMVTLVYVLMNLDKKEEEQQQNEHGGGHH